LTIYGENQERFPTIASGQKVKINITPDYLGLRKWGSDHFVGRIIKIDSATVMIEVESPEYVLDKIEKEIEIPTKYIIHKNGEEIEIPVGDITYTRKLSKGKELILILFGLFCIGVSLSIGINILSKIRSYYKKTLEQRRELREKRCEILEKNSPKAWAVIGGLVGFWIGCLAWAVIYSLFKDHFEGWGWRIMGSEVIPAGILESIIIITFSTWYFAKLFKKKYTERLRK